MKVQWQVNLLFKISFAFILISLVGIAVVALVPTLELSCIGIALFASYYLLIPILAFLGASFVIRRKCSTVYGQILAVENRVLSEL